MLGFQTKSSPTVDKWVHLYISGERLEENVGIARCKKLKDSAWGLHCSCHYIMHEGYDLCCELTLFTGHWQTFQILSLSILLKPLCQLFGSVTLQFTHHHAWRVQQQYFSGTGTKRLPNLHLLIQLLRCELHVY